MPARMNDRARNALAVAACCGAALLAAPVVQAKGVNCALARANERASQNLGPTEQLMQELSDISGFGLLSNWTVETLGSLGEPAMLLRPDLTDWTGAWRTAPLDKETGKPQLDLIGGFTIEQGLDGPWLDWRIDASDPCEGRTYLPLLPTSTKVLRIDVARVRDAAIGGLAFDGPDYSDTDRATLSRLWHKAEPILQSVTLSRANDACQLSYEAPDGRVRLTFYCNAVLGE